MTVNYMRQKVISSWCYSVYLIFVIILLHALIHFFTDAILNIRFWRFKLVTKIESYALLQIFLLHTLLKLLYMPYSESQYFKLYVKY